MDGILLINKEKDYTSRDVVNVVSKILKTKKVGHFGTLDPLATGLLVVGIGKYTKFGNVLDDETKEYEVEVLIGKTTDTYDITGNVLQEDSFLVDEKVLKKNLYSFKGIYMQEVPIYSSVKVNGKRLYEYARNKEKIELPKKKVEIIDIRDFSLRKNIFSFTCKVSKGTYIRSLINDLSKKTKIYMCMNNLKRTKCGLFDLNDSYFLSDIKSNKYKLYDIEKIIKYERIEITPNISNKIVNGNKIDDIYNHERIVFTKDNKDYVLYEKENDYLKPIFFF